METEKTDLSGYDNSWYSSRGGWLKRVLWYYANALFFLNPLNPSSTLKVVLLKLFGAKVGRNVVIKPGVNIKYPWLLSLGDNSWIGERVWIDNLVLTEVGSSVCISQGALLITGNHDFSKKTFDLMVGEIKLEDGVWIGAKAIVGPGVTCRSHSVLAINSVATSDLDPYCIYQGNPAVKQRERQIR